LNVLQDRTDGKDSPVEFSISHKGWLLFLLSPSLGKELEGARGKFSFSVAYH